MNRGVLAAIGVFAAATIVFAQGGPGDPTPVESQDGRYYDAQGVPTFNIAEDGTVDFPTYSGFRRYNSECFVCHGPDGAGSSYAPALVKSVTQISYDEFVETVVNGRQSTAGGAQRVMPPFGTNPNVMCYLNDIYVYLRARGQGDLPRGRPAKKEPKPEAFSEAEDACMG